METISNQTCTKCQHCGEWTNYADDPHHKARTQARVAHDASLDEIALRTARNIMPLMNGSIKELCQLQAQIQIAVREALDDMPLNAPRCAVDGVAIPDRMCVAYAYGFCIHDEPCDHKVPNA